jgi:hypothetical protein
LKNNKNFDKFWKSLTTQLGISLKCIFPKTKDDDGSHTTSWKNQIW